MEFADWSNTRCNRTGHAASIDQTFLWNPCKHWRRNIIQGAFELDYLKPTKRASGLALANAGNDMKSRYTNGVPSTLNYSQRRLSIYIQQDISSKSQPHNQTSFNNAMSLLVLDAASDTYSASSIFPTTRQLLRLKNCNKIGMRCNSSALISEILNSIFGNVLQTWEIFIYDATQKVSKLQSQIYPDPANDMLASALWEVSKQITHAQRLLRLHMLLFETIERSFLPAFPLFAEVPIGKDFERIEHWLRSGLELPINQMVDLMYKSISIRDAGRSIELNTSLWRLSWITFIFLPLTWLCGFFDMNVSWFEDNPSAGGYFCCCCAVNVFGHLGLSCYKEICEKICWGLESIDGKVRQGWLRGLTILL